MAISSNDIQFSAIKEVTLGTTPTTGATRHELPIKSGASVPQFKGNAIQSDTMRPNRASNGSRRGNSSGEGSFDFRFQNCGVMDLFLESALSGTWQDVGAVGDEVSTLKAGKTDVSMSVIAKLGAGMFRTSKGVICNSVKINGTAAKEVSASFGFVFIDQANGSTDNAITVTEAGENLEYLGAEVDVTVAGQTLNFTEFSVDISQDRTMRDILGSYTPIGVGASGTRKVKFTAKAFRENLTVDALIDGTAQEIVIEIGTVGDGYRITIPAAYGSIPYDETAESMMVVFEFDGGYDSASGTDVIIEKL